MNQQQRQQFIDENPIVKQAIKRIEKRQGTGYSINIGDLQKEVEQIEEEENTIENQIKNFGMYIRKESGENVSILLPGGEIIATVVGEDVARRFIQANQLIQTLKDVRIKLLDRYGIFGGGQQINDIFEIINKVLKNERPRN